ncbi:MAG: hypothetical protein HeimC2_44660 [Candidatus Heimdallarchaeota archaeon LC_2]|nr:MAG: hypothetical protein HeimC2_44660 [Candidatus Heimdallarchaeota archaeon LC_2]
MNKNELKTSELILTSDEIDYELSHSWGATHDDGSTNIMKTSLCSCTNWDSDALLEIGNLEDRYDDI